MIIKKNVLEFLKKMSFKVDDYIIKNNSSHNKIFVLTFHSVHQSKDQNHLLDYMDPNSSIPIEKLEILIEFLLSQNVRIINSSNILNNKLSNVNVMLSFDDGYYNNHLLVDLADKFNIPIEIFISTKYIENQSLFWWDIMYCNNINPELFKKLSHNKILSKSEYLYKKKMFSDLNRPLSINELKIISNNKNILIGNHTHSHMILNKINSSFFMDDVKKAQLKLNQWIGYSPHSFAFPNGNHLGSKLNFFKKIGIELTYKVYPDYFINENLKLNQSIPRFMFNPNIDFLNEFEATMKLGLTYRFNKLLYFLSSFKNH